MTESIPRQCLRIPLLQTSSRTSERRATPDGTNLRSWVTTTQTSRWSDAICQPDETIPFGNDTQRRVTTHNGHTPENRDSDRSFVCDGKENDKQLVRHLRESKQPVSFQTTISHL